MEALQAYYNNLFSIEITTLGIITAGTFVFLQILYSDFSYREMLFILKRKDVLLYSTISIFVVLMTGIGSLLLSVGAHDFIPKYNLLTKEILYSDFTALVVLIIFLTSVALGISTVYKSIKLLNPSSLIRKNLEASDNKTVRKFLYNIYGVPTPFSHKNIMMMLPDVDETGQSRTERESKIKEAEDLYTKEMSEYEQLKKDVDGAPDIFEGFVNLMSKAVRSGDAGTVKKGIVDFTRRVEIIIRDSDSSFPLNYLARYIGENLTTFIEVCARYNIRSFSPFFIRDSLTIALMLLHSSTPNSAVEILKSWKGQADSAIKDSDKTLFREIIRSYQEIADAAFEKESMSKEKSEILDESFRNIGWLAERLLTQKGLEIRPMMYDSEYQDELDTLYNTLFHFEHKYNNRLANAYPLVFFDAVHVLFDRLLEIYKSPAEENRRVIENNNDVKNKLFSCAFAYYSFASDAINVSNSNGVALAALNLKQVYERAFELQAEDVARDCIDLIVGLAIIIATNPDKMTGGSFLTQSIDKYLEEVIINSPYFNTIKNAVAESYMKFDEGPHDKKLAYIKHLGSIMNTDFGLGFK